jgi:parallel beta-helix repeat protein
MKRKWLAVGIILLFVGTYIIPAIAQDNEKLHPASRGNWLYVGGSGPGNYTRIQDAIDDASDGDTIFVYNGTYHEHITVDKQLVLQGIPSTSEYIPYIDGGDEKTVVITADNCIFERFAVGSDWDYGIFLQSNESIIRNCSVFKSWGNIKLYHASHNLISQNIFRNSELGGIALESSSNNAIMNNIVDNPESCVVNLWRESCYNLICNNEFSNSHYPDGIVNGENCSYNIYKNNMANNSEVGFYIIGGYDISITNNVLNNGISFSSSIPELVSDTIENNTINDKYIYFYTNEHDGIVPGDAGQIVLIQCKNFKIQNLTISNIRTNNNGIGGGVCLINSSQTTIQETKISSCKPTGIYMVNSDDNTLSSNTLSNNYHGIYCERSKRNVISDNIIQEGSDEGIYLYYSPRNTIKMNTISQYSMCILLLASNFNIIDENTIMNKLVLSSNSDFNQIIQNHIQGGVEMNLFCLFNIFSYNTITNSHIGIWLDILCNSNRFINNNITNNEIGVQIINCRLNIFKRNNFIHNTVHAYFEDILFFSTLPDFWRRNYWDDWDGLLPKRIEGKMIIFHIPVDPEYPPDDTVLEWSYFDLFPAKKPYDLPGTG